VSKRILIVEDFHAKTERGVKQELFAHFVLVTLNRLFANRADLELHSGAGSTSPSSGHSPRLRQTNFKNCIHVLDRGLEALLFLPQQIRNFVQSVFSTILGRHQRVRPNRSFLRRSFRPVTNWRPAKPKIKTQNEQKTATAPA